ncbi:MAG: hypothetical protein ACLFU4_05625, partial [Opitutales bacterium]
DLSGVAINDDGRWLTMVSENVYLSAAHFAPASGSSVTFYAGNDPSGVTATRTLTSTQQQIGSTDLYVGTLDAALPGGFTFYDFATEDITSLVGGLSSFSNSIYNGENAYVFGRSPTSFSVSQDMAVGRNKIDRWFGEVSGAGSTGDAIGANIESSGDADFVQYEADLRVGDSGAPLFAEDGSGGLTIVGINWFNDDPDFNFFGTAYTGNDDAEIQDFINAHAVPEASSFGLVLGLSALGLLVRRRGQHG